MVNGYVNAPKELYDITLEEISSEKKIKKGDELFNKFYEFVMIARHKVPVVSGTFRYSNADVLSLVGVNIVGTHFHQKNGGYEVERLSFTDYPSNTNIIIEVNPNDIIIRQESLT